MKSNHAFVVLVNIKVTAENVKQRLTKHTNTCYFTMVAKGDNDKSSQFQPLKLTTKLAMKHFAQALLRKELK